MAKPHSKTKIICTLGPASSTEPVLHRMAAAGMDVARLNFSHSTIKEHKAKIDLIRKINGRRGKKIQVLQDLEGYRIRIGRLKDGKPVEVKKGQVVILTNRDIVGGQDVLPFDYKGRLEDVRGAEFIYINDGNISLKVKRIYKDRIETKVWAGGLIGERKGVNMPGARLHFSGVTDKDKSSVELGIRNKVDFIAQSFVRNRRDILNIAKLIRPRLPECKIIAKIENRFGIGNIDEIIGVSDGIMIARGDMGVSMPIQQIPIIQKMIIKRCNRDGKFAITATQMLESMTENLRPTRAEVTDVANAILDGTNYVMLSGETAVGRHPVETVKMMKSIVDFTEGYLYGRYIPICK
ncbi:MAG: pyruvate kinase [Candidatus Omnitrophica bacterium]|nr:pyruvate kinase [Candidatus Omnitrophota bacterium]